MHRVPTIRDFDPADYPAIVRVFNSAYSEYPSSEEEIRFRDAARDPKCRFRRFVALDGDEIAAYGEHDQLSMMYHPRKFWIEILVQADREGRGFGRALYQRIQEALEPFAPLVLRAQVREDRPRGHRFLTDRGFEEERRSWESRLDPTRFDFSRYPGHVDAVRASGIEIRTYRELMGDPDHLRKLQELDWEAMQDMPMSDPPTRTSEEVYRKAVAENPDLLPDAFFIAVDRGRYVGISNLWSSQGNDDLYTGLTGTARAYRRRGIALALKLCAIAWARDRGCTCIKTWNDSKNPPMLAINAGLGFVRQPAWVLLQRRLREEEPASRP